MLASELIVQILTAGFTLSAPILLPSVGEVISERAGIVNIGIEGYMMTGAIISYLAAYATNNIFLAACLGMLAAVAVSMIHGYLTISLGSSQLLSGIGINIFAAGLSVILYRETIFKYVAFTPKVQMLATITVPVLSKLPVLGPIVFQQNLLVYIGILMAVVSWFFLYRTYFGLTIRAVGEDPLTVDASGLNPTFIRYAALMLGASLAGLGGAYLVLAHLGWFVPGMTAGRGFVALAIVIASNWNPLLCFPMSYLFGLVDALQLRVQVIGYESVFPFLMATPYLFATIVLVARRRVFMPAALAVPYFKKREKW